MTVLSFEEFEKAQRVKRSAELGREQEETMKQALLIKQEEAEEEDGSVVVKQEEEDDKDHGSSSTPVSSSSSSSASSSPRAKIGMFVELPEVQLLIIVLIYLDIFASILLQTLPAPATIGAVIVAKALDSFHSFAQSFFVLEMALLAIAFDVKLFMHLGYVLDLFIITFTFCYGQHVPYSEYLHLLGFLRCWRILRLVFQSLDAVHDNHDVTKSKLNQQRIECRKLKARVELLEETRTNEIKHRRQVEGLVRRYKEEVDMLAEALRIAANDVAGAAVMGEMGEEASGKEEQEAVATPYVDEDGDEFYEEGERKDDRGRMTTVVIKEDGAFEIK